MKPLLSNYFIGDQPPPLSASEVTSLRRITMLFMTIMLFIAVVCMMLLELWLGQTITTLPALQVILGVWCAGVAVTLWSRHSAVTSTATLVVTNMIWLFYSANGHADLLVYCAVSMVLAVFVMPLRHSWGVNTVTALGVLWVLNGLPLEQSAIGLRYLLGGYISAVLCQAAYYYRGAPREVFKAQVLDVTSVCYAAMSVAMLLAELCWPVGGSSITINLVTLTLPLLVYWVRRTVSVNAAIVLYVVVFLPVHLASISSMTERGIPLAMIGIVAGLFLLPRLLLMPLLVVVATLDALVLMQGGDFIFELEQFLFGQLLLIVSLYVLLAGWMRDRSDASRWSGLEHLIAIPSLRWPFVKVFAMFTVLLALWLWPLRASMVVDIDAVSSIVLVNTILLVLSVLAWMTWVVVGSIERQQRITSQIGAAEAAAEDKRLFLSTLSHEMRTPLNGIMGMLQVLKMQAAPSIEVEQSLGMLDRSATQIHKVVEDVLDLSRLRLGKLALNAMPTSLPTLLAAFTYGLELHCHSYPVTIAFSSSVPPVTEADIDEPRVLQVLEFFSQRIVKSAQGPLLIEVVASLYAEGLEVSFVSANSGDVLRDIRRAVKRQEASNEQKALIYHMCQLLNVQLSGDYQNNILTLRLPMRVTVEKPMVGVGKGVKTSKSVQTGRALVVDDDTTNRLVLKLALGDTALDIDEAASGDEALTKIRSRDYAMVVTDISMPNMSGEQLLQQIRKLGLDLPVIAVTGLVDEATTRKLLAQGFTAVLHKPLNAHELHKVLNDL